MPTQFYETPRDVIASVLEPGNNTFYKLYKILIERAGEVSPYKQEDFSSHCFKFEDGMLGCFCYLPRPESVMLCSAVVYIFRPDLSFLEFFTVETDEFMGHTNFKLCSIDKDLKHTVHTNCSFNANDIILKIKDICLQLK